mmetsp:Transcript_27456/g.92406  ORF Transcript_27456/g.92406 Transcript_27456/m.92406 type:complete len:264 (+) Transcript_27456:491-1282(+)
MRDATNWSRRTSAPASKLARCTRTSARYSSRSTPFALFRACTTRRRCGSTPTRPAHRRCLTCTPWRERRVERCWAGWAARRAATRSWSLAARAAARRRRRSTRSHSSSPSRWAEVEAEERSESALRRGGSSVGSVASDSARAKQLTSDDRDEKAVSSRKASSSSWSTASVRRRPWILLFQLLKERGLAPCASHASWSLRKTSGRSSFSSTARIAASVPRSGRVVPSSFASQQSAVRWSASEYSELRSDSRAVSRAARAACALS